MDTATSKDWTLPGELWLPAPGREGEYEASDLGRARSLDRYLTDINGLRRYWRGRVLSISWDSTGGYGGVNLGKGNWWRMHILVLTTFVGPCPEGLEGLHRDGNKRNNALSNLEWNTTSENMLDVVRHGHHIWAKRDTCAFDHLLVAPNVSGRDGHSGWRRCLACQRARAEAQRAKQRGERVDLRAVADRKYAEIMNGTTGRRTSDAACLYGHPLVAPNLVRSALPRLDCLACSRAYASVRRALHRGEVVSHQAESDRYYAAIAAKAA